MANEYKSPWKQDTKENEEVPAGIRRPADYVEPKQKVPKRDPEKELAEWEQTPENLRRPRMDMNTFGLRDAIDKNVRMMSDEDINAERTAEREERAKKLQPTEQKKEAPKAAPAKGGQAEPHAATVSPKTDKTQPSQQEGATVKKNEVLNAQEVRDRMKALITSDDAIMKDLSPEERTALVNRLSDPKTAEEMRNTMFLIGDVNGQPVLHQLTMQESVKLNLLEGKGKEQYAAQLLEAEMNMADSQIIAGQKEKILANRENAQSASQTAVRQQTDSLAQSPMGMLLKILFSIFGLDVLNSTPAKGASQQQGTAVAQEQKTDKEEQQQSQLAPVHRLRSEELAAASFESLDRENQDQAQTVHRGMTI